MKYRENELYLLGHGENKKEILEIKEKIKDKRVHYIELAGIQEVIALIKKLWNDNISSILLLYI